MVPPRPARALAHRDERLPEAWAPQGDAEQINLKMKMSLKFEMNPI
jgi:hypothetical protein